MPDPSHTSGFGDSAERYAAFRPGYPPALFERLFANLDGSRERAVDLGAGSGQATRTIIDYFSAVTAVEPDQRMAEFIVPADNLTIIKASAEDVDFECASIDTVICATSFHWMNQPIMCAHVAAWLRPGGVFFPFLFGPFKVEGNASDIFRRHARLWGRFKDARLGNNVDYAHAILENGNFEIAEKVRLKWDQSFTPQAAAGLCLTLSYARAYADAHEGKADYLDRLTNDFLSVSDEIIVTAPLGGVIARRKSSL